MRTDKLSMGAYGLSLEQVAWYQNCKYPCSLGTHFPEVSSIQHDLQPRILATIKKNQRTPGGNRVTPLLQFLE